MEKFNWKDDCYFGYLNMDHRTDRFKRMKLEFERVNLNPVRHRGKRPEEYDLTDPSLQVMKNRTPGAIACHFGQVGIMKTALEIGMHAVVFEDDIKFCDDFDDRMDHISEWCSNNEFDVFWLGASFHSPASSIYPYWHPTEQQNPPYGHSRMRPNCSANLGYDVLPTDNPRIVRTYGAYITFAYIVNVKSIQKILDLFDKHIHTSIGIDWLFIKLQPQLKCYAYVPGSVMQIDNVSDIGQGMTVWSGQLKNGPYVFKPRLTDFDPSTFNFNQ